VKIADVEAEAYLKPEKEENYKMRLQKDEINRNRRVLHKEIAAAN
jgi:hypothetical protein